MQPRFAWQPSPAEPPETVGDHAASEGNVEARQPTLVTAQAELCDLIAPQSTASEEQIHEIEQLLKQKVDGRAPASVCRSADVGAGSGLWRSTVGRRRVFGTLAFK